MLAVWEYFWDEDDWVQAPEAPAVVPDSTTDQGSKKGENVDWPVDPWLEPRLPEHLWEAREQHLKRLKAESERIVPHEIILQAIAGLAEGIPDVQAIAETVASRERAFRTAQAARGTAELNEAAAQVLSLTKRLAVQVKERQDEEDLLLLLMVL